MYVQRTVKIPIENQSIRDTTEQYFQAYKFCIEKGTKLKTYNKTKLHNATYKKLRKEYPKIPSALLQTVRDVACENLKAVKLESKPIPKNKFIRYDKRTFSYHNEKVSLSTINGRQKFNIHLPKYAKKYKDWICNAGTITLKNNQLWLNLIFIKKMNEPEKPKSFLGIDRGINNIAVCSDNKFYNSKRLKSVKGRYQYLKARLQSKGTPSAMRHLKRLSGRERRFVRNVNHCLSKEIVQKPYDCFVLENIKKIRKSKKEKKYGKKFNKKLGNWSYFELGNFIQYKAEELGKTTIRINPAYTSQKCSKCGDIKKSNRNGNKFKCKKCGFELNADLNASRNIANSGKSRISRLSVNQPNVATERKCSLNKHNNFVQSVTSPLPLGVGN